MSSNVAAAVRRPYGKLVVWCGVGEPAELMHGHLWAFSSSHHPIIGHRRGIHQSIGCTPGGCELLMPPMDRLSPAQSGSHDAQQSGRQEHWACTTHTARRARFIRRSHGYVEVPQQTGLDMTSTLWTPLTHTIRTQRQRRHHGAGARIDLRSKTRRPGMVCWPPRPNLEPTPASVTMPSPIHLRIIRRDSRPTLRVHTPPTGSEQAREGAQPTCVKGDGQHPEV